MEFSMYILYDGVTLTGRGTHEDYYKFTGFDGSFLRFEPYHHVTPQGFLNGLKSSNMYDYKNYNLASSNEHSEEEIIKYIKSLI